jgi:hypothetical protein
MAKKSEQRKPKKAHRRRWANQYSQVWTNSAIERLADEMLEWFRDQDNIWLKDFSVQRMVHFQRFDEWTNRNGYFAFIYSICKSIQESKLVKLGLSKQFNASMPIFALKNVAGWRDVRELTGPEGQPLIPSKDPYEELAEILIKLGVTFPGGDGRDGGKRSARKGSVGPVAGH